MSLPGRWRSGTTAPPLNTGRRFEPRRGRWRLEGWVLIPGGGFLAVERGAGGLELEDSAAFAFGGRQYLVTCTEIYILFARTLHEAGLLQFYSCNVKHMGTSELESTTSVPIRDLYSTV